MSAEDLRDALRMTSAQHRTLAEQNMAVNKVYAQYFVGGLMVKSDEVKETKPKKEGPKFEGMALEMDVIKKMAHQLDRLPRGTDGRIRVLEYMARVVAEEKLQAVSGMDKNGQLIIPGPPPAAKDFP